MVRVQRAIRIPAPASAAWQVLGDFRAPELGAGIVKEIIVEGEGVGAVRTMILDDRWGGGYVQERLEAIDATDRTMTYRMVDSGPVPFADYVGTIRVTPAGPDQCVAVMTSCFVPVEIDDATAERMSIDNIERALANARAAIVSKKGTVPFSRNGDSP